MLRRHVPHVPQVLNAQRAVPRLWQNSDIKSAASTAPKGGSVSILSTVTCRLGNGRRINAALLPVTDRAVSSDGNGAHLHSKADNKHSDHVKRRILKNV
jgi:hypothetical protein